MHHYSTVLTTILLLSLSSFSSQGVTLSSPRLLECIQKELLIRPSENLYVLGTVHIGAESALDAEELIRVVQPSKVVVEISPSRLKRLQRQYETTSDPMIEASRAPTVKPLQACLMLPAFIQRGWSAGKIKGMLVAVIFMWPSVLKISLTSKEEEDSLPRRDEFAAAVYAAIDSNATIIPAEIELEDLILQFAKSVSPVTGWMKLAYRAGVETSLGIRPYVDDKNHFNNGLKDGEVRKLYGLQSAMAKKYRESCLQLL